jgi:hypothetical protein
MDLENRFGRLDRAIIHPTEHSNRQKIKKENLKTVPVGWTEQKLAPQSIRIGGISKMKLMLLV